MKIKFLKYYSEKSLFKKLATFAKTAGEKVVYTVLLLFYLMKDKKTGLKTKITIAAALGYFILPTDAIFDLTPIIGYSDDLAILAATLYRMAKNITPEISAKARAKLKEWFSELNDSALTEIEKFIPNLQSDDKLNENLP